MKKLLIFLFFGTTLHISAQELVLKKGAIIDSIPVNDSIPENFIVYLPKKFETLTNWPIIFVFDMEGKGKQALAMFGRAAEEEGYILAASNNVSDTLSTSQNILIASRMFNKVLSILPIQKDRVYTAGFSNGARLASVLPVFISGVEGVISCGAAIRNFEILNNKNPFHFIGIVGKEDFNYAEMLTTEKNLNKIRFPNQLLVFEGGQQWPQGYLQKAMKIFTLAAMAKGIEKEDRPFINESYVKSMDEVNTLIASKKLLQADDLLGEVISVYRPHIAMDSLKDKKRSLKKEKLYKALKRNESNILFKESLIKDDYVYYLEEDILTYNFNNLGWWNYQMEELKKYGKSKDVFERQMGKRLLGFINALVEDNIEILEDEKNIDGEALGFLWMLKTITDPKDYSYYAKIISYSAKNEDFGTALFYLEELLKNGYKDIDELYALEHTALLKITPEFNEIVAKYLKDARYDGIEE